MLITICAQRFKEPLIGGVDVYSDRLGRALMRQGHKVSILAFDPEAETGFPASKIGPEYLSGMPVRRLRFSLDDRTPEEFATGYDARLRRPMKDLLQESAADLLIVMNFYIPSLAIVDAAKDLHLPIAYIATDYVPICRRATFIRWDGHECDRGESLHSCSACFVSHKPAGRLAAAILEKVPVKAIVRASARHQKYRGAHPLSPIRPYLRQIHQTSERLRILPPVRRKIDLVLAPTTLTRRLYIENGFDETQVELLPFGVDPDSPLARVSRIPTRHVRFLFVGRLQPYKGLHLLVRAFKEIEHRNGAKLTVYGTPGGYPDYYDTLLREMNDDPDISFRGQLPLGRLDRAFANTDYFVLPSLWHENSPLILVDAVQSQTPVIASAVGGVSDLVQDGFNGLLFPMGNLAALSEILQRAIQSPELSDQLRPGEAATLPLIDDYSRALINMLQARFQPIDTETRV